MRVDRRIMAAVVAGLIAAPSAALADNTTPAATPAPAPAAATPAPAATTPAPAATAPAAAAPATVPNAVQAWAKFCDPDPKGHVVCIVRKLVFNGTTIIGSLSLRVDSSAKVPVLAVAAVPVGVQLRPGLRWKLDTVKKAITVPFWRCTPQNCESEQIVRADIVANMRKGKQLTLTAKDVANKDFVVTVSLAGFAAAYDNKNAPTFAEYSKSLPQ